MRMILNIVDHRKNRYRWREITAIFEPTFHDNSCKNSDLTTEEENLCNGISYHEIKKCSLNAAIRYAIDSESHLTVYLYDLGEGIKADG